jgi:hypothetical protein
MLERKRWRKKNLKRNFNKIKLSTIFGLALSIINTAIAIISKNLLYIIISLPIFIFFVCEARKDMKKVKRNGTNEKN